MQKHKCIQWDLYRLDPRKLYRIHDQENVFFGLLFLEDFHRKSSGNSLSRRFPSSSCVGGGVAWRTGQSPQYSCRVQRSSTRGLGFRCLGTVKGLALLGTAGLRPNSIATRDRARGGIPPGATSINPKQSST